MDGAMQCGCRLVTHLYSCTSTVTRDHGFRRLGVIEHTIDDGIERNIRIWKDALILSAVIGEIGSLIVVGQFNVLLTGTTPIFYLEPICGLSPLRLQGSFPLQNIFEKTEK